MKAVLLKAYGDVDQLVWEEVETPKPGRGEVLVKIAATNVNPVDWKLRTGARSKMMPLELPAILGRDLAGVVVELGSGVTGFRAGQRVMASANGTYAEYAVVKAEELAPVPERLGFEEAAALPLVAITGSQLIERGVKIKEGQSVFVTGALGGVGRTAVYIAGQHKGQVIAAVKKSQMAEAESLGTLGVVSLDDQQGLAKFQGIDAIADTIGGPPVVKLLKHLRKGGTYATVVGAPDEAKDYDVHIEQVRAQPDATRLGQLAEDVAAGRFKIPIAKVMKLSEIREAHRLAQGGGLGGKIVLVP